MILLDIVLVGILILSVCVQMYFYVFIYGKAAVYKIQKNNLPKFPISVIIVGRNEETNVKSFLPRVLSQNYPQFEVVFVNDRSSDHTSEVLTQIKTYDNRLKIINIDVTVEKPGKKYALTQGIYAAQYEHLVMIDADVYPLSDDWLNQISEAYNDNTEIVLGYGAYEKRKGFLNKLIRFDALFIALQYLSIAKFGLPYMGTGRNLSYKKSLFIKHSGFEKHMDILSGDDDLFVNEAANDINTEIVISNESKTLSVPKTRYKEWFHQKRRHLTTGRYYRLKHLHILGIELLSRFMFWLMSLIVMICIDLYIGIAILLVGLSIKSLIISIFARKVKEFGVCLYIPIFDIIIPIINFFAVIKNSFVKVKKWN
jgi:hypothetical protein